MDWIANKYILIAVGLFITIIILTSILGALDEVGNIYNLTNKTNISIKEKIDTIYSKYDGVTLNGVDLINTLKIYENDSNISIELDPVITGIPSGYTTMQYIKELMDNDSHPQYKYHKLFDVTLEQINNNEYKIIFKAK